MKLRSTDEYSCQAWTVSAISMAASLIGIGALGIALWQLIYTQNFVLLIGIKMRNVYAGYAALGGFMVVCAILGICASLTRNTHGLLSFAVLMFASLICQCGVWAYTYLERNQVSANLLDNLQRYTVPHKLYQGFLQQELNCTFSVDDTMETLLELCKNNIDAWFWTGVLILLSFSAALMAFQFLLLVTSLMLRRLVIEAHRRNRVYRIHIQPSNNLNMQPRQLSRTQQEVNEDLIGALPQQNRISFQQNETSTCSSDTVSQPSLPRSCLNHKYEHGENKPACERHPRDSY